MAVLSSELTEYINSLVARHDEAVLNEMEAHAAENGFPIVGRLCGVTLEILARLMNAKRVFELGSGFGYSAWWFARGVGRDGRIWCTDGDEANATRARDYLGRAGVIDQIDFQVTDALTGLAAVDGTFDIVYCDVDKDGYPACFAAARDRIRTGGLWICDNTLWSGRVLDEDPDEWTSAILEHNRTVADDPGFVSVIVPQRDGLLIAQKIT